MPRLASARGAAGRLARTSAEGRASARRGLGWVGKETFEVRAQRRPRGIVHNPPDR